MPGSKRRGLLGGKVESIVINVYSVTDLWREATHPGRVDVVSKVFVEMDLLAQPIPLFNCSVTDLGYHQKLA